MNRKLAVAVIGFALVVAVVLAGCKQQPAAPAAPAAAPATPADAVITPPTTQPGRIGVGDLLAIAVSDLLGPNTTTMQPVRVDRDGTVRLIGASPIHVAGLSDVDAEDAVIKAYQAAHLIEHADVYVRRLEVAPPRLRFDPIANFDLLRIAIFQLNGPSDQEVRIVRVDDQGMVGLPYIGKIQLAGLSEAAAEASIAKAYGPKGLHVSDNTSISLLRLEQAPADASQLALPDEPVRPVPDALKALYEPMNSNPPPQPARGK